MKVTNWRRKLAATLLAGGLISPTAAYAANLNANLVTNGDFETVDLATLGEYNGPRVLGWTGPSLFAYAHNGNTTNSSLAYDWADGADPPGAGSWYFTPNNTGGAAFTDVHDPGLYYQDIDVSTGASGSAIASGKGRADLQAYMSSYSNDTDFANVRADFRDGTGASLGFSQISDSDPGPGNVWSLNTGSGAIPVGTTTLRVSLFGTRTAGGAGADGYTDNVDVRIIETPNVQFLFLEVNTATGQAAVKNQTGAAVNIDYYEVTSTGSALNATAWNSLQEQNLAGFPAGNGTGNGWEQAGGSNAKIVSESYLTGNSAISDNATIGLGTPFNVGGDQDLVFRYAVVTGPSVQPSGDYNGNGVVDAADYTRWRDNLGSSVVLPNDSTPGTVTAADYSVWKANFGNAAGPTGTGALIRGFVRYVTSGAGAGSVVPEPSSVLLVGIGLSSLAVGNRRRTGDS